MRTAEGMGMKFVRIEPGTFVMGSPESEIGRDPDERQHTVTLTQGYWIADCCVTNRQYRAKDPAHAVPPAFGMDLNHDDMPCGSVSLAKALEYCTWLSNQDLNWEYDLPTEAQWEYAARAGNGSRFFWGEDESRANEFANVYDRTAMAAFPQFPADGFDALDGHAGAAPVRSYATNAYGLYDVLGNSWEFCKNRAYKYPTGPLVDPDGPNTGVLYTVRGGDWLAIPFFARLANRTYVKLDEIAPTTSFRLVARPRGPAPHPAPAAPAPAWTDVAALFTQIDIAHMKAASAAWPVKMDLSDYDNVRYYAMKIYSSVRDGRMPIAPVPTWTPAMKEILRRWIYAGCPK